MSPLLLTPFLVIFLLVGGTSMRVNGESACVYEQGASYNDCEIPNTEVFFCRNGRGELYSCHTKPNKEGYCCRVDQLNPDPNCKAAAPETHGKWYRLKKEGKFKLCRSILVKPLTTAQCTITIGPESCPFLFEGTDNNISIGATRIRKTYKVNGLPKVPAPPTELSYNGGTDLSIYTDDGSNLWVDPITDPSKRDDFTLLFDLPCTSVANDYCEGRFSAQSYVDYSGATPIAQPTVSSQLLASPYFISAGSNPERVINNLARGHGVTFVDTTPCGGTTPEEHKSCCERDRLRFWEDYCTLHKVTLKRIPTSPYPAPPSGGKACYPSQPGYVSPPPAGCYYYDFTVKTTLPSSGITVRYFDPNL